MNVCTSTNLGAVGVLFLVLGSAACAGNEPAPVAAPGTAPTSAAPAASATAGTGDTSGTSDTSIGDNTPAPDESAGAGGSGSAPAPDGSKVRETRTAQVIAQIIRAHRKPFRACYDKAHKQLPGIKGNMTLHFVLDPEGKVKSAKLNIARSDIKAPAVVDCAIKALEKLEFPPSSRGMQSAVNYPFNFKPH